MIALPISRNPWLLAALSTTVMGVLMLALDLCTPQGGSFWQGWITEHSTLVYFCEPTTFEALFRQKIDTYSNLGFFFTAMLLLGYRRLDRDRTPEGFALVHPTWTLAFAIAMLTTFTGSSIFHASLTLRGEALDLAGTYASALLPGFFNLHRLGSLWLRRHLPATPFLLAWLVIWLICSLLIFQLSSRVVVPGGLILIGLSGFILWLRVRPRRGWWFAGSSIALTVLAASFFVMDIERVGCDPGSWYQAHSIWHLLAAAAAGSYYGFMRRLQ